MHGSIKESEELEQEAWKDSFAAVAADESARLGLSTVRVGRALVLAATGVRHFMLNRAIGFGEDDVLSARELAAHYARSGVSGYMVHVSPGREDSAAPELLAAGFAPFHRDWVKLARRGGPIPETPPDVTVVRAADASAAAFGAIFAANFDLPLSAGALWTAVVARPRWHCFVAVDGGTPIAAGALFVDGEIAYLAGAATRPEYRGQGAQTALIAQRLRTAASLGCRAVYAETGVAVAGKPNHSENNLLRLGFRPLARRRNFVPGPALVRRTASSAGR